jgi:hypothetical protein
MKRFQVWPFSEGGGVSKIHFFYSFSNAKSLILSSLMTIIFLSVGIIYISNDDLITMLLYKMILLLLYNNTIYIYRYIYIYIYR